MYSSVVHGILLRVGPAWSIAIRTPIFSHSTRVMSQYMEGLRRGCMRPCLDG